MQLERISIRNFRGVEDAAYSFVDEVGRVQPQTLLVGPNGTGKTTALDAIAAVLGPALGLRALRPGLQLTPGSTVRRGAIRAEITCAVRFDDQEVQATSRLLTMAEERVSCPSGRQVDVAWEYPDPRGEHALGRVSFSPPAGRHLFRGRTTAARLLRLHAPGASAEHFRHVGGVSTFDQQRTGIDRWVLPEVWDLIGQPQEGETRTANAKAILVDLALREKFPPISSEDQSDWQRLRDAYASLCAPHTIVGPVRDETGLVDIIFSDGLCDYRYDGLSSGEQMLLLLLLRFVTDRIHKSLVLIDEIELHLHPVWQRRLLALLPRLGEDNQYVMTTHSPFVRDLLPAQNVRVLDALGDRCEALGGR